MHRAALPPLLSLSIHFYWEREKDRERVRVCVVLGGGAVPSARPVDLWLSLITKLHRCALVLDSFSAHSAFRGYFPLKTSFDSLVCPKSTGYDERRRRFFFHPKPPQVGTPLKRYVMKVRGKVEAVIRPVCDPAFFCLFRRGLNF